MGQRVLEHLQRRSPSSAHLLDREQLHLGVARENVVHKDPRMVLLLLELYVEPVGDTLQPLGLGVHRHRKIEIGRPKLGIDLRVHRFV